MRLKLHILFQGKRIRIGSGKQVAPLVCPLLQMIIILRESLRRQPRQIDIYAADRLYRTRPIDRLDQSVIACGKMRLHCHVAFHRKRIGIGDGKAVARRVCPFRKMIALVPRRRHRCRRPVRIEAVALLDTTVFTG
ncbi:hypothetical protein Barb7_02512 [Bacteroidales bacterium Barb7]|nr:hypothetical protein Barb7_02512 [Bacteroidales bacterium Barb7]